MEVVANQRLSVFFMICRACRRPDTLKAGNKQDQNACNDEKLYVCLGQRHRVTRRLARADAAGHENTLKMFHIKENYKVLLTF